MSLVNTTDATEEDLEVLRSQLGRVPRGVVGIAARCVCGRPTVVATAPRLLLLDEPTAGMNPSESEEMVQLFQRICEERGVCVLMIEHDMKVVMGVSQRILVLNFGRQIALGSPREVLENEEVITAYLGHQKVM